MRFEWYQGKILDWAVGGDLGGDPYALEGRGLADMAGTRGQVKLIFLDVRCYLMGKTWIKSKITHLK